MNILYKRMLKDEEYFQSSSKEQQEKDFYLRKQTYLSYIILKLLIDYEERGKVLKLIFLTTIMNIVISLLGWLFEITWLMIFTIPIIVLSYAYLISLTYINKKFKNVQNEEETDKVYAQLTEKISNIYLFNYKVISRKSWSILKKDKAIYDYIRSEECNNQCYATTYVIANIINDPKVNLFWIAATDFDDGHKFGHAVLTKNGWIYDSNMRRTYKFDDYVRCYEAEIFKEFSINEYSNSKLFLKDSWNAFGIWCKERNVKRSIED